MSRLKPRSHVTSGFAFMLNGLCVSKWWCSHIKFAFSRIRWHKIKEKRKHRRYLWMDVDSTFLCGLKGTLRALDIVCEGLIYTSSKVNAWLMVHSDRAWTGPGPGKNGLQYFMFSLLWELKWDLLLCIVSVPVPFPHNFWLIIPTIENPFQCSYSATTKFF